MICTKEIQPPDCPDEGACFERSAYSELEHFFIEQWKLEMRRKPGINHGRSILECILNQPVSLRDRYVAASVVQWLGTNCGFSFLHTVLGKIGNYIHADFEPRKKYPYPHDDPLTHSLAIENAKQDFLDECALAEPKVRQMIFDLSEPT
jgi:hypothetical protein